MEFEIIDAENSHAAYVVMCELPPLCWSTFFFYKIQFEIIVVL